MHFLLGGMTMSTHSLKALPAHAESLDIAFKALAIRSLQYKQTAKPDSRTVERVRGEFNEMPGFSPTLAQMARLFALPMEECNRVLAVLLEEGFLCQSSGGRYRVISSR
jgi:hypothetical protein